VTLKIKRIVPAAPPVVFRAFSTPDELAQWWGPDGFTAPSLIFNPCVGDSYRIQMQPPFAVPPERRDPVRRLRGRLVAPVTIWTAGHPPGGAGLTVSSVLVAEGQPARLLGLIDPTSAFWEALQETRAFVVHLLAAGDRPLAERFSEVRPPIRRPFERLDVAESPWGPVLGGSRPRAACRLAGSAPVGHAELVEGVIEQLELPDLDDPLAYLHGGYRSMRDLEDHG